ncbi:MAG TPA: Cys-tRNA(Pro) deacylase [Clostridiales bacterium]|nr:Cys-tRNA(Pro) deacylase [Clostridiales bacterium]
MRILDKAGAEYKSYSYERSADMNGIDVANAIQANPDQVFKTLVTVSKSKQYYVFLVPVVKELDLKKASACVHEKSIEMLKSKDLLPVTGYVHGGCSPIGMKKSFCTTIDSSANHFKTILFSAGKIGHQVEVDLEDLKKVISFNLAEVIKST